jgi:hypothetical protein
MKRRCGRQKNGRLWAGLGLGTLAGYVVTQQVWALWQLVSKNVAHTLDAQAN